MKYIGKLDKAVLKNIIQPAYKNYKNINHDLSPAKCMILDFIMKTHTTTMWYSIDDNDYKLNLCSLYGLKINLIMDDDVTYHICVRTGRVFVA